MTIPSDSERYQHLTVVNANKYRLHERIWVDNSRFCYAWEQSTAGSGLSTWTEKECRLAVPLSSVEPLLRQAETEGTSEALVEAELFEHIVKYTTVKYRYSGDAGTETKEPELFYASSGHRTIQARLTFTPQSVAIDLPEPFQHLMVVNTNRYRSSEDVWADDSRFWYKWEEEAASGGNPDAWTEEYYRLAVPLSSVEPLLRQAETEGTSEALVEAEYFEDSVYVDTYSGIGGTKKEEPEFDERTWRRGTIQARLTFTPQSVAIDLPSHRP